MKKMMLAVGAIVLLVAAGAGATHALVSNSPAPTAQVPRLSGQPSRVGQTPQLLNCATVTLGLGQRANVAGYAVKVTRIDYRGDLVDIWLGTHVENVSPARPTTKFVIGDKAYKIKLISVDPDHNFATFFVGLFECP